MKVILIALLCVGAYAQLGDDHILAEQLKRADSLGAINKAPVVTERFPVEEAQRRFGSAPTPGIPRQRPVQTKKNAYQDLDINKLNIKCWYERKTQTFQIEHDGYVTVRGTYSSKTGLITGFMEPIINPRAADSQTELRKIMTSEATKKQILDYFGTIIGSESDCLPRIGEPE